MQLPENPHLHLTYCLNVHKGEEWEDMVSAVQRHSCRVRDLADADQPFGLGLRLGARAAAAGAADEGRLGDFQDLLRKENLYAFSVNGFPYGEFHDTRVKEAVYRPDWTTPERLNYTKELAGILAVLVPDTMSGSISTVPVSYKPWIRDEGDVRLAVENLAAVAGFLAGIKEERGREIHLGLEPEPDCFLETTAETVRFFTETLFPDGSQYLSSRYGWSASVAEEVMRRHIGVCFDTCHVALQFEDLATSWKQYLNAGIRISKTQISNALEVEVSPASLAALEDFVEPVYLHQAKGRFSDGKIFSWPDLPEALENAGKSGAETVRVHFHVPLFFDRAGLLSSTAHSLDSGFFNLLLKGDCAHVEIETYAYHVLPESLQSATLEESIAKEYQWLTSRLNSR